MASCQGPRDLPVRRLHTTGSSWIGAWLKAQRRLPESLTPIERLCYTGVRGMGALEYRPALFDDEDKSEELHVDALAELAAEVLRVRTESVARLVPDMKRYASILRVGSSAGGARAKALIGWNEATGEVRSGQIALPGGFGYWLVKFDGIAGNGDREGDDKWGYGRVEYAYHLMARAAGIEMTECRLWDGRHFMTRRFDRLRTAASCMRRRWGRWRTWISTTPPAIPTNRRFASRGRW